MYIYRIFYYLYLYNKLDFHMKLHDRQHEVLLIIFSIYTIYIDFSYYPSAHFRIEYNIKNIKLLEKWKIKRTKKYIVKIA